ncbi:MAG: hypothetical protein OEZ28_10395, partial [Nitrospinota bacterium]|nr:hypothetical protein [Nitrospinota bacterium]
SEFSESDVDKVYQVARQLLNSPVTVQPEKTSKLERFSMHTHLKNVSKLQTDEQNQTIEPEPRDIIAQNSYFMGLYRDHWGNSSISSSLSAHKRQPISEGKTANGQIEKRISNSSIETLLRIPSLTEDSVHETEVAPKMMRTNSSSETGLSSASEILIGRGTVQPEQTSRLESFSMNTHQKNASKLKADEQNQMIEPEHLCPIYQPNGNSPNYIQLRLDDKEPDTYYFGGFKSSGNPPVVTDPHGRQCPTIPYEDFLRMRSSAHYPNYLQK